MTPLSDQHVDVLIVGSGFGGCLSGLILQRLGLKVAIVDRSRHPRFAIGESSTPAADLILKALCQRYELSELLPLTAYGSWRNSYPHLLCGLKRGFSYFHHSPQHAFWSNAEHSHELLVAASDDDELSDTHWYRPHVDQFFANAVQERAIPLFEETAIQVVSSHPHWELLCERERDRGTVTAKFIIDASGAGQFLAKYFGIRDQSHRLLTHSRALYGHFENIEPWGNVLADLGISTADYHFECDAAALHHILRQGWMWQLRFHNGLTSVGFVFDLNSENDVRKSLPMGNTRQTPILEWEQTLSEYPSLMRQCAAARPVSPETGLVSTERLQRLSEQSVGSNWAMLPFTAGFIDPLHSTGIAHTLSGVERLMARISSDWNTTQLEVTLRAYQRQLEAEFLLVDRLVWLCYESRRCPERFRASVMLYIALALQYEGTRRANDSSDQGFLGADDPLIADVVEQATTALKTSRSAKDYVACVLRLRDRLTHVDAAKWTSLPQMRRQQG